MWGCERFGREVRRPLCNLAARIGWPATERQIIEDEEKAAAECVWQMADIRGLRVTARYGMRARVRGPETRRGRGGEAALSQSRKAQASLCFCEGQACGYRGG
eukprot:526543-Alexandrium_andersonii.AAC.1